jgi:16S rRNA (adenine1518-N6/adenine1519-N6)-dimethyltransferase
VSIPEWEDPRRVLGRHGLAPKRGFSQNFLVSRHVVERIADAVADCATDGFVVELGPGLGTLTGALLRKGLRVLALDADPDMLRVLRAEFGHVSELTIQQGDATTLDLSTIAAQGRPALAGNLPYAVTGAIMRRATEQASSISGAVFMVQKEVRDRLIAPPGVKAYGALTVFTHAAFEVSSVCKVSAGSFHPAPRVDSAVVRLMPHATARAELTEGFALTVRAAFSVRRKMLRNALAQAASTEAARGALDAAGIDGRRRGESLSVEEFATLAEAFASRVSPPPDPDP